MAWLYEQGETFRTVPGLTPQELTVLQLGYVVRQEEQERQAETAHSDEHPDRRDLKQQAKVNARERYLQSRKPN